MQKPDQKTTISLSAMFCVSGLAAYALSLGIDGAVFSIVIAAICGVAGYELRGAKLERLLKDMRNKK